MEKITDMDFSKHELIIYDNKLKGDKHLLIHDLKLPDSVCLRIKFINTNDTCLVTGDFGRWSFCREFWPSADGFVSGMYWLEKLRMYSTQDPARYDSKETNKEIQELVDSGLEESGYDGDELKQAKDWFINLLQYVDDEIEYTYEAYRGYDKPEFLDYEMIPFVKEIPIQLKIVFDAFNEICNRLKN